MSEVYKTIPGDLYFTSFSVVNGYDVFIRNEYQDILVDSTQFWQHDNHPFELYSNKMMDQKVGYIHNNPVEACFTDNREGW